MSSTRNMIPEQSFSSESYIVVKTTKIPGYFNENHVNSENLRKQKSLF